MHCKFFYGFAYSLEKKKKKKNFENLRGSGGLRRYSTTMHTGKAPLCIPASAAQAERQQWRPGARLIIQTQRERCLFDSFSHHVYKNRFIFSVLLLIYSLHHAYRKAGYIIPTTKKMKPTTKKTKRKWWGALSKIQTPRERCLFDSFSHHVYEKRFIFSVLLLIYSVHHAYRLAGHILPTMKKTRTKW